MLGGRLDRFCVWRNCNSGFAFKSTRFFQLSSFCSAGSASSHLASGPSSTPTTSLFPSNRSAPLSVLRSTVTMTRIRTRISAHLSKTICVSCYSAFRITPRENDVASRTQSQSSHGSDCSSAPDWFYSILRGHVLDPRPPCLYRIK
jgi:hypothetical protein